MRLRVVAFLFGLVMACARSPSGEFDAVGSGKRPSPQPQPRVPLNACDWDGRGSLDAGQNVVWAFRGPDCVAVGGVDAGEAGVFATLQDCQQSCPCAPSKFQASMSNDFPACDAAIVVPDAGDVWEVRDEPLHLRPGVMADLCRASLDAGVAVISCWVEQ